MVCASWSAHRQHCAPRWAGRDRVGAMPAARGARGPLYDIPRGEHTRAARAGIPAPRVVIQRAAWQLRRR
jgi:hypothetical protein